MDYKEYLNEFAKVADEWFLAQDWMDTRFQFYKKFFTHTLLEEANWADIQKLGENIHSFQSMALAKGNALGRENLPIEDYRKRFIYLMSENDPINQKIDNLKSGPMSLPNFGDSSISELIAYAFPNDYVVYNRRDAEAVSFLGIDISTKRGSSFGDRFLAYNKGIEPILDAYKTIVGQRTKTTLQLELDQFFSWLYTEKIDKEKTTDKDIKRYWIIAPGEKASFWNEFHNNNFAALGWDELGDLSKLKSKSAIKKLLQINPKSKGSRKNDVTANFEFAHVMSKGDILFVKAGRTKLIGRGVVTSDYYFDDASEQNKSRRNVDWSHNGSYNIDWNLPTKTLTDVSTYLSEDPDFEKYVDKLEAVFTKGSSGKKSNNPINQILYGPPGTGKTYYTLSLALKILGHPPIEKREDQIKAYERERTNGKIVFTTFHQSMSYEDFIEGIKPTLDDDTTDLGYEIKDGILKSVSKLAIQEYVKYNDEQTLSFDDRYDILLDKIAESDEGYELRSRTGTTIIMKEVSAKDNITVVHENGKRSYIVSKTRLEKIFHAIDPQDEISNINKAIRSVIGGSNATAYWAANEYLHKLTGAKQSYDINHDLSDIQYQNIIRTVDWKEAESLNVDRYVIIIDEINRGNVSGIFGELITLLEQDKRIDQKNRLVLKLPYSKTDFALPSNLYIIGTMNTADRSVEALDTALRRRFSFKEVMPNTSILQEQDESEGSDDIEGINLVHLLTIINKRIKMLIDRDHQIGHSYFLGINNIEDLREVFKNKIIPLLQEYFYNDYSKIMLVLGKGFVYKNRINSSEDYFAVPDNELDVDLPDFIYDLAAIDDQFDIHLAIQLLLDPSYKNISESE